MYREALESHRNLFLRTLERLNLDELVSIAGILRTFLDSREKSILVCGNGGSSALSQHFAIDLGLGTQRFLGRQGCRVFDLTANSAVLTAAANDTGFENVFSSQIELYAKKGDLLIAISSSGNSKNIIEAVSTASKLGLITIGLTGFDGGVVRRLVNHSVHVETEIGLYGTVEDTHSFVLHALTYLIRLEG